jgi:hypothetical protein
MSSIRRQREELYTREAQNNTYITPDEWTGILRTG